MQERLGNMTMNIKSPLIRIGGKFYLRDFLAQYIPKHVCYVEPFAGAAHLLFAKTPSQVEIINDIDNHLVNFFQVIRDHKKRQRLIEVLEYMPYSRELWKEMRDRIRGRDVATVATSNKLRQKSYKQQLVESNLKEWPELSDRQVARESGVSKTFVSNIRKRLEHDGDVATVATSLDTLGRKQKRNRSYITDVQKAAEWFYLNRSSFGGDMQSGGFALPSTTGRNTALSFRNAVDSLEMVASRLRNVCIENLDWKDCIQRYDSKDTLFFCDPPYLNAEGYYGSKNFAIKAHRELKKILSMVKGHVMLTHYQNTLYDGLYRGWGKYTFESFKGSSKANAGEEKPKTVEVLYCNFKPEARTRSLFNGLQ